MTALLNESCNDFPLCLLAQQRHQQIRSIFCLCSSKYPLLLDSRPFFDKSTGHSPNTLREGSSSENRAKSSESYRTYPPRVLTKNMASNYHQPLEQELSATNSYNGNSSQGIVAQRLGELIKTKKGTQFPLFPFLSISLSLFLSLPAFLWLVVVVMDDLIGGARFVVACT